MHAFITNREYNSNDYLLAVNSLDLYTDLMTARRAGSQEILRSEPESADASWIKQVFQSK